MSGQHGNSRSNAPNSHNNNNSSSNNTNNTYRRASENHSQASTIDRNLEPRVKVIDGPAGRILCVADVRGELC